MDESVDRREAFEAIQAFRNGQAGVPFPALERFAAPIFDHSGEVFSALSVSGPRTRLEPLDQQEELIRLTMQTAQEISAKLGYLP